MDDFTDDQTEALSDFDDDLAEHFSRLILLGISEEQIRAEFEAVLSLQTFTD